MSDVTVTERGADAGGAFCADFDLRPSQVADFFSRAAAIDAPAMHARFDYLPCYVRGIGAVGAQRVTWEIRAGGTATLRYPDGLAAAYGCASCGDLLGGRR